MRVTHIITRLIVGGAQENTVSTVLGLLQRHKIDVDLISGPTSGPEGSLEALFDPHPGILKICPHLVRPIHPWYDLMAMKEIVSLLRARQPDIVHTHSGKAGIIGRLAARLAGTPLILHTIHGPSFGKFQGALPNLVFAAAEKIAARVTCHFITVANAMAEQYIAAGIARPSDYTRIFSGFDLGPFLNSHNDPQLRHRYGILPEDLVIGTIARLAPLKGHDDLVAAARPIVERFPNAKFLLVGDGPSRPEIQQRISKEGLSSNFVFAGLILPEEVPKLTGIMDLLVHLSLREGLPRALPQALAAGKPVVAYDCDGAREVCLASKTGFLITAGKVDAFIEAVYQLGADPALRMTLGENGRTMVRGLFSVERMTDEIHSLYLRFAKS